MPYLSNPNFQANHKCCYRRARKYLRSSGQERYSTHIENEYCVVILVKFCTRTPVRQQLQLVYVPQTLGKRNYSCRKVQVRRQLVE